MEVSACVGARPPCRVDPHIGHLKAVLPEGSAVSSCERCDRGQRLHFQGLSCGHNLVPGPPGGVRRTR